MMKKIWLTGFCCFFGISIAAAFADTTDRAEMLKGKVLIRGAHQQIMVAIESSPDTWTVDHVFLFSTARPLLEEIDLQADAATVLFKADRLRVAFPDGSAAFDLFLSRGELSARDLRPAVSSSPRRSSDAAGQARGRWTSFEGTGLARYSNVNTLSLADLAQTDQASFQGRDLLEPMPNFAFGTTDTDCFAGGPGSSSCSISNCCSVTCTTGYACCHCSNGCKCVGGTEIDN